MEWNEIFLFINSYENSWLTTINSLIKNSKSPISFEISQFDKDIKFYFKELIYTEGVTHIDPNINQALHHYLINTKGDFNKYLIESKDNFLNPFNIGFLNNLTYSYIATSKIASYFLNTGVMKYELLSNKWVFDRTLIGVINYQYLSRASYIFATDEWLYLTNNLKMSKLHQINSDIYIDMIKNSTKIIEELIKQNMLPHIYSQMTLNEVVEIYKTIIEITFDMSKEYSNQFENLDYKLGNIDCNSICQICYDANILENSDSIKVKLNGLITNKEILKSIDLGGSKKYDLKDVINEIKNKKQIFFYDINLINKNTDIVKELTKSIKK